jgi:hypothetical protein
VISISKLKAVSFRRGIFEAILIDNAFELTLEGAAIEAFGGAYDEQELLELVKVDQIKDKAISVLDYAN